MMKTYNSIPEYIATFPKEIQEKLSIIHQTILKVSPELTQTISYGMPTIKYLGKNAIHFAAFNTHFGIYPGPQVIEDFKKELSGFDTSKGTIRIGLEAKLPLELIRKITKYRIESIEAKSK